MLVAKIKHLGEAKEVIQNWKSEIVVFTNGCFDLLHPGHIDLLEKASELGDKLIVGLNSDRSVRQLKGMNRPYINEKGRAKMLSALSCVDLVVVFDEQTPIDLIARLEPNVLVKGSDYEIANIIGGEIVINNGGVVKTIELLGDYSTTHIINKIKGI